MFQYRKISFISDIIFSMLAAALGIALFLTPSLFEYEAVRIIVLIGLTVLPLKYLLTIKKLSKP